VVPTESPKQTLPPTPDTGFFRLPPNLLEQGIAAARAVPQIARVGLHLLEEPTGKG
jgi:hypothetical protein